MVAFRALKCVFDRFRAKMHQFLGHIRPRSRGWSNMVQKSIFRPINAYLDRNHWFLPKNAIKIDTEYVEKNLGELIKSQDLSKFIL